MSFVALCFGSLLDLGGCGEEDPGPTRGWWLWMMGDAWWVVKMEKLVEGCGGGGGGGGGGGAGAGAGGEDAGEMRLGNNWMDGCVRDKRQGRGVTVTINRHQAPGTRTLRAR